MNLSRLSPHQLLVVDIICAFSGAILFYFLFDFLHQVVGLPLPIVKAQLTANFTYGVVGVLIYLSGPQKRLAFFQYLIIMNFVYSVSCLVLAAVLLSGISSYETTPLGACVLITEGLLILALAIVERRSLRNN